MESHFHRNFGILVAYVLPGFVVLAGMSLLVEPLGAWLALAPLHDPSIGSFLYLALASLAVGLTTSGVRWALIDTLHHATGIKAPRLDFSKLQQSLPAFSLAVEHNYSYYKFYSNMLVAVPALAICVLIKGDQSFQRPIIGVTVLCLEIILWFASRDCLRRFYQRAEQILGCVAEEAATER